MPLCCVRVVFFFFEEIFQNGEDLHQATYYSTMCLDYFIEYKLVKLQGDLQVSYLDVVVTNGLRYFGTTYCATGTSVVRGSLKYVQIHGFTMYEPRPKLIPSVGNLPCASY